MKDVESNIDTISKAFQDKMVAIETRIGLFNDKMTEKMASEQMMNIETARAEFNTVISQIEAETERIVTEFESKMKEEFAKIEGLDMETIQEQMRGNEQIAAATEELKQILADFEADLKKKNNDRAKEKLGRAEMPTCTLGEGRCREVVEVTAESLPAAARERFSEEALEQLKQITVPEDISEAVQEKLTAQEPKIVDDKSYISRIKVCHGADEELISGLQFVFKSTATGIETTEPLEGYTGSECPEDKEISLGDTDCITKLNVAFDENGNGFGLIYRRREATDEESMGFKEVTTSDLEKDNVPAAGCLNGYNLGFDTPASSEPTVGASRSGRFL